MTLKEKVIATGRVVVGSVAILAFFAGILFVGAYLTGSGQADVTQIDGEYVVTTETTASEITVQLHPNKSVDRIEVLTDGKQVAHVHMDGGQRRTSIHMPWGNDYTLHIVENGTVVETVSGTK